MKNRLLSVTRGGIPYIKELRPRAGSVAACVVMQQLDFRFNAPKCADGFYKFLEPCNHAACRFGDTWTEELGMTADEFRTAFDKIGIRYTSKTAFNEADGDKFQGRFYCSYHDKKEGLTWYFRNHEIVDALLDSIVSREESAPATVTGKRQLLQLENASYINGNSQTYKPAKAISRTKTESTTESTQKTQQQPVAAPPVVAVAQASLNDALPDAQTEILTQRLQAAKVSPKSAAAKLAAEHPQQCAAWLDYVAAHPKLGAGFLRKQIESGEMPAPANNGQTPETKPAYIPTEAERAVEAARLNEAAQIAFDALSVADRAYIEKQSEMQKRELSQVMWELKNSQMSRALKSLKSAKK